MILIANSFHGYENLDQIIHFVTKRLKDKKTHTPTNNQLFRSSIPISNQMYEVQLLKWELKQKRAENFCIFHFGVC